MSAILFTGNSTLDGTGEVGRALIFEAGDDGCPWPDIEIKPRGTNVANLVRLFSNNGRDPEDPKNNKLFAEVAIPASGSKTKTTRIAVYGCGWLFPGCRIFATIHHATAGGIEVEAKLRANVVAEAPKHA